MRRPFALAGAVLGRLREGTLGALTGSGDTVTWDRVSERVVIRHRRHFRHVTRSVARSSIEGVELLARGRGHGRSHIRI